MAHHHELCFWQDFNSSPRGELDGFMVSESMPQSTQDRLLNAHFGRSDANGNPPRETTNASSGGRKSSSRLDSPRRGIFSGWLIAKTVDDRGLADPRQRRFLQLGTGQWCPAVHATWFPKRKNAVRYVQELGSSIQEQVEIVYLPALEETADRT